MADERSTSAARHAKSLGRVVMPASDSLHVLMTCDAVGGVWTYAIELAAALALEDVRVSLAVMGPAPDADQRAAASRLPNVDVFERACRLEWMDAPWSDVDAASDWLLDLADCIDADVVHLNGYSQAARAWKRPVVVVAHSCVLSWWQDVHGQPAPDDWSVYASRVRAGLQAADLVVAPTSAMRSALEQQYGRLRSAVVIPNGRRAIEASPRKEPLIFTAGRTWDAAKNIGTLCAVASDLSWPVYVAGDLQSPAGASMEWTNVTALGRTPPDLTAAWMARAAVYALPARYEPFGLSVLEAAQAGCALVLGDIPSLRENWDGAARFVHPDDKAGLRRAIQTLIDDEEKRVALADRSQVRARRLNSTAMAQRYADAYARLLSVSA